MAVDSINGTSNSAAAAASKRTELGQDAFLHLMVAQMKNQDPTKPADPSEFLGQLAQFSTVSGIQEMRDSISSLSTALRGSQVLGGTSLVGREVIAAGDTVKLGETGSVRGATTIPEGANEAVLVVTDASGQLIRQVPLDITEGSVEFTWDGLDGRGDRAPPGSYHIAAIANVGGYAEQLETQLATRVASVSIDPNNAQLTLNTDIGPIDLAAVRQVL